MVVWVFLVVGWGVLCCRKLLRKQFKMKVFERCVYRFLSTAKQKKKKSTFQVLKANLVVVTLRLPTLPTYFHYR